MKQYGILAYPAKHSLSPAMHNAAFKALSIDAQYGVFEVPRKEELAGFMDYVRGEPVSGLSVSLPYKEEVINYLDEIDEDAMRIGAVNTILNKNGVLWGYNTDFVGSNMALKNADWDFSPDLDLDPDLDEKIGVVLGGGGAARAVTYGLLKEGVHVWIKNRTRAKADRIAVEFAEFFDAEAHSSDWENVGTGDVLINATSFWYKNLDITEKELPHFCSLDYLKSFEVVMDLSYNIGMTNFKDPLMTPLLLNAEKLGKKIVTGDKMLLYQATEQFKIWTGKDAPLDVMRKSIGV